MPLRLLPSRPKVPPQIHYKDEKRLEQPLLDRQRRDVDAVVASKELRKEENPIFLLLEEHPITAYASAPASD